MRIHSANLFNYPKSRDRQSQNDIYSTISPSLRQDLLLLLVLNRFGFPAYLPKIHHLMDRAFTWRCSQVWIAPIIQCLLTSVICVFFQFAEQLFLLLIQPSQCLWRENSVVGILTRAADGLVAFICYGEQLFCEVSCVRNGKAEGISIRKEFKQFCFLNHTTKRGSLTRTS